MTIKQNPKSKKPKKEYLFSEVPDQRDILAIVEGGFGKSLRKTGRFFNANYPPDDVSHEELEKFWGDPKEFKDISEAELERIRTKISSRKTKPC